jgi:hypothetical protein
MKNRIKVYLGTLALLLTFSANVWALPYPVTAGDYVKMSASDNNVISYEGHYQAQKKLINGTFGAAFGVFCVELSETFNIGGVYKVANISNYAEKGGYGGSINGQDPISNATKWLYYHFLKQDIQAATNTAVKQNDYSMQLAIWMLEDELNVTSSKSYLDQYNADTLAQAYVSAAIASGNAGQNYDVMVMNLIDSSNAFRQSQLVGAPVPEPSTFLLLGAGLLGAGLLCRRSRK